ncbi:hydroxylysine kinase isoform X2 [Carettochelys insculpta]|uniref:hydroxylysine kinase isoform X2 n=1 Tax=Carettochelys insculpta TaxID=44489 RepID=UPI003EBA857B
MSSGNIQQPQTFNKPVFTEKEATDIVERVFGLKVSEIRSLPSYEDQNFHVHISRNEGLADGADEYVLKIANCKDSQNHELIEVQTRIMMFLHAEGFPSATPHVTKDGNIMSLESLGAGSVRKQYMVRLLTYLPGRTVATVSTNPHILYEVGKLAAKLDKTLAEKFHHPAIKSLHRGTFIWNLANVPILEQYIHAMDQNSYREAVEQVIHQFKDKLVPKLSNFRPCINHGDLNDHNILLDSNTATPENPQYSISGILDFSDMSYGYYVFELAITIMYMMIESKNPLSVGGHVIAGFESILPLTTEERDALFLLVCGRFAQSLVLASYTSFLYPENKEYLMITAKTGGKHLFKMLDTGQEAIEKIWFETAQAYSSNEPV